MRFDEGDGSTAEGLEPPPDLSDPLSKRTCLPISPCRLVVHLQTRAHGHSLDHPGQRGWTKDDEKKRGAIEPSAHEAMEFDGGLARRQKDSNLHPISRIRFLNERVYQFHHAVFTVLYKRPPMPPIFNISTFVCQRLCSMTMYG